MGKVFIKTDVLGRPHRGIGGGLTSLGLAPALVFCPPLCHAPGQKSWRRAHAYETSLVSSNC